MVFFNFFILYIHICVRQLLRFLVFAGEKKSKRVLYETAKKSADIPGRIQRGKNSSNAEVFHLFGNMLPNRSMRFRISHQHALQSGPLMFVPFKL